MDTAHHHTSSHHRYHTTPWIPHHGYHTVPTYHTIDTTWYQPITSSIPHGTNLSHRRYHTVPTDYTLPTTYYGTILLHVTLHALSLTGRHTPSVRSPAAGTTASRDGCASPNGRHLRAGLRLFPVSDVRFQPAEDCIALCGVLCIWDSHPRSATPPP